MPIVRLDKKVITFTGNVDKFFQGLTSNSLDKPFNAFLNINGRIIATIEQKRISDDILIAVVATQALVPLTAAIERFARLNKTTITVTDLLVYHDTDRSIALIDGDESIDLACGRLLITTRQLTDSLTPDEYTRFRLQAHFPLHTIDFNSDEMILNVHEHDYVSYTKGCFLGQEPVAKVHHRAKPTWKLAVRFADQCTPEEQAKMTSKVSDTMSGRMQGFVFVKNI